MDVTERLKEYVTLPLIGRGHRGRLIQAAMRDGRAEIERLRAALAAERERCAKIAEYCDRGPYKGGITGSAISDKIRQAHAPTDDRS